MKRLEPLFKSNGAGTKRRWTLELVIERLKSLRKQTIVMNGVKCKVVSSPDEEQSKILDLLNIKL